MTSTRKGVLELHRAASDASIILYEVASLMEGLESAKAKKYEEAARKLSHAIGMAEVLCNLPPKNIPL